MNLLIVAPGCAPDKTGQSLRVFNWIKMVKDHVRVTYLSTYQKTDPQIAHVFYHQEFPDSLSSKARKLWTYYKTDYSRLKTALKPDIVQIHTPYFFGIGTLFPGIPKVIVEHDVNWNLLKYDITMGPGVMKIPFKFPIVPWLLWRAKRQEKKFLKEADHIFVCSSVDKRIIVSELPQIENRITVIPNSIDLGRYTPSDSEGEGALFMGSLTYSANLDAADIICTQIAPLLPDITFKIMGGGDYGKPYPNNVKFLGHVDDIRPHLKCCRLFIVPLRFGSGTRWKILEAMATKRPVVSTPKGAEGLDVTHGKDIFIADIGPAFARAVKKLHEDAKLSRTIAENGRRLVEKLYDYKNYTQEVVGIYKDLAERKR